jgi:fido (protein-threonine AMPylation protein)
VNWGDLAIGFLAGIASSAVVAYFVYRKQKQDAQKSEQKLVLLISRQLNLTGEIYSSVRDVTKSQSELSKDFQEVRKSFGQALASRDIDKSIRLAQEYTNIAGSIAENSVGRLLSSPPSSSNLTIQRLSDLHKSIFPQRYELAGQLRKVQVWIGEAGSSLEHARYVPPSAKEVPRLLKELLTSWNSKFSQLKSASRDEKIDALSEFHHRFLSILPFPDGNGRIARLLLGMQVKDLFGKNIDFFGLKRREYYDALYVHDNRDSRKLRTLIGNLVDETIA